MEPVTVSYGVALFSELSRFVIAERLAVPFGAFFVDDVKPDGMVWTG